MADRWLTGARLGPIIARHLMPHPSEEKYVASTHLNVATCAFVLLPFLLAVSGPAGEKPSPPTVPDGLPVNAMKVVNEFPLRPYGVGFPGSIRNRLSIKQIRAAVQQADDEIVVDFSHVTETLDGCDVNPKQIYGRVICGPYPFESSETKYAYLRMRAQQVIKEGRGKIDVRYFLSEKTNSEDWNDAGQVAIRLELRQAVPGTDLDLGNYDTFCMFRKTEKGAELLPSIVEGPFVNLVTSDDPTRCVVSLESSQTMEAAVQIIGGKRFTSSKTRKHEIEVTGLRPNQEYKYQVMLGEMTTREYRLQTAPEKGATSFRFAYGGDSREGVGGGLESHMGCNFLELERLAAMAFRMDCRFLLQGGDLVMGYTTHPDDYRTQFYGWKHAVRGYMHTRPVYPAMGNHECLIYNFDDKSKYGITLDRWPYELESSEAIFGEQLVLPTNGPESSNPHRPSYKENVFSFHYGNVKCIAVNNNYWISYAASRFGGSPEGYIMPDQMDWIQHELQVAEKDPTVKYVIVYMQEPVIPNGGHLRDSMWYNGNNNIRSHTWDGKQLNAAKKGIIEVRNDLMKMLHASSKVAAVLGSDEHGYSKILIDGTVPLGAPAKDDLNDDGWINWHGKTVGEKENASTIAELKQPVWYLVGGGFGAPYYSREHTPWNDYWTKEKNDQGDKFYYSSQSNILIFDVSPERIAVVVYNPYGEEIDRIDDLMAIKETP